MAEHVLNLKISTKFSIYPEYSGRVRRTPGLPRWHGPGGSEKSIAGRACQAPDIPGSGLAWEIPCPVFFFITFSEICRVKISGVFEISVRAGEILGQSRSKFLVRYLQSSHNLFDIPYAGVYCRGG